MCVRALWAQAWVGEALCRGAGVRVGAALMVVVVGGEARPSVTEQAQGMRCVILFIVRASEFLDWVWVAISRERLVFSAVGAEKLHLGWV